MKKIFALAIALFAFGLNSYACDGGCTIGGSYLGILPQVHKNFFGVRYLSNTYTITSTYTHSHDGVPETHHELTENIFRSAELWGRYTPVKGMQVFAFVPYRFNQHIMPEETHRPSGLGDITLLANYAVLNTGDSATYSLRHTLRLGGGIKLPTGHFGQGSHHDGPASMQPGTGSTDYILTGIYTIRYNKIGLNSDVTYNLNSENKEGYQFGNRVSASSNLFYWHNTGAITILPSAGLYYEKAEADQLHGEKNLQTGGESIFATAGLSVYVGPVATSVTVQKNLSTTTVRDTRGNSRMQLSLAYLF
ncbi:hypothetical protein [Pontibacter liquoris]|uniref:hypothetical protein n=1 Tax=Pontibacter liquoris TaxID=2905677 RepID=UPI001FA79713|nr:hypothetical protein [Pontibacter liquoris]